MESWNYFIDASTTNTGITLVSSSKIICTSVNFSKIYPKTLKELSKAEQQVQKLHIIRKILDEFTKKYPLGDILVMEGIYVQPKFLNSSEFLLKLHGFLIGYFDKEFIQYYPPSVIKKKITGNGNANKKIVQETLEQQYQISFSNDDQSDSLAVYEYWRLEHDQPFRPVLVQEWKSDRDF